jgi:hypothetical protein
MEVSRVKLPVHTTRTSSANSIANFASNENEADLSSFFETQGW